MSTTVVLQLPRPLAHQLPVLNDPSPRKLWRAGRRTGKSVAGRIAAIRGHGPKTPTGKRALPGMLDGANVAWLTKTYKQSKVVWRKLLKAFRPLEGIAVKIDREDKRIEAITGQGAITVWSGHTRDAIDNLRGDAYDGVLLDEAAYMDLEYALNDVVEPALLDHGGWVFVFSSPNAAWDGNEARQAPSFFNRLCAAILAGKEKLWQHWHNRTEDNPRLDRVALQKLRDRLGPDSPTAQQELDASLIAGGLLALRIDRPALLVEPVRKIPPHWPLFLAFDWGYNHPYSVGLYAVNEDGHITRVDGISSRQEVPSRIIANVKALLERYGRSFADLSYTVAGHDCWHDHKARGERAPTIAEQCARAGWYLTRASISRVTGLNNLRAYLDAKRVTIADTPNGRDLVLCLETRISDPKHPEDVLKQDADQDGKGGDDFYDEFRYGLASRPMHAVAPVPVLEKQPDRATPYDYKNQRLAPKPSAEREMGYTPSERHTAGYRMPRRAA